MSRPVYDETWIRLMRDACLMDTRWLVQSTDVSHEERVRFLENEVENPEFSVSVEAAPDFNALRAFWNQFLARLQKEESNTIVRELYEAKIDAQFARLDMIEAAEEKNDRGFLEVSRDVYGVPQKQYFKYIAKRIQELLSETTTTRHTAARQHLEKVFKKIDTAGVTINPDLLPTPQFSDEYIEDALTIADIFSNVLKKYAITDWTIKIDTELRRRTFAVKISAKEIYIPSTERIRERSKRLTRTGVEALAEHEIGVHVVRSVRGAEQPLQLLSFGLDHYLRGEEGVATYRQQRIEGASEYYGFDRYLAASLVLGLDGHERDFRALFEVMQDYYLLTLPETDDVMDRARNGAWDIALRLFRGTTGQTAGCCYTRDIIYFEGNIGIWKLLSNQPEWDEYLTLGKYDPLNDGHVDALRALDILEI